MAKYTVTDPQGKNHQVTAPDNADSGSILGFVHNMVNQAGSAIQGQWDKGAPYRVALGALMSGDTTTAKKVINDNFANTTPQDIGDAAVNAGVGFMGVTAWHGSPHLFDKFSNEAIGTGEGAQAYGHGIYLAENKNVAQSYQDAGVVNSGDLVNVGKHSYPASSWQGESLLAAKQSIEEGSPFHSNLTDKQIRYADAVRRRGLDISHAEPNLYKTEIPDSHIDKMLDWDKPLSEQSQYVQDALKMETDKYPNMIGEELYRKFAVGDTSRPHATQTLQDMGIPGIKYLDGSSRTAGEGTRNFVMFNPEDIRITERNGVPTGNKLFSLDNISPASKLGFDTPAYHGTANDISEFVPGKTGAVYVSPDAETANGFASRSQWYKNSHSIDNGSGPNVMPVLVRGKNIFDYENPAHMQDMQNSFSANGQDISNSIDAIGRGEWRAIEHPDIQNYIKKNYDGFHINEEGVKNIGIYDPVNIRSRFAAFDPTMQNSANILAGAGAGTIALSSLLDQGNR